MKERQKLVRPLENGNDRLIGGNHTAEESKERIFLRAGCCGGICLLKRR